MKLAILSESPGDEAALRVLVEYAVGRYTQLTPMLRARSSKARRISRDTSANIDPTVSSMSRIIVTMLIMVKTGNSRG